MALCFEQNGRDAAMAFRQPLISEYISVLSQAVDAAENDPAQLRSLVYDLARLRLGGQSTSSYSQTGNVELLHHLLMLEIAISRVEIVSRLENEVVPRLTNEGGALLSINQSVATHEEDPAFDRLSDEATSQQYLRHEHSLVANQSSKGCFAKTDPPAFLTEAQILRPAPAQEPIQSWQAVRTWEPTPALDLFSTRVRRKIRSALPFVTASGIALVALAVVLALFDYASISVLLRRPNAVPDLSSMMNRPPLQATPSAPGNTSNISWRQIPRRAFSCRPCTAFTP